MDMKKSNLTNLYKTLMKFEHISSSFTLFLMGIGVFVNTLSVIIFLQKKLLKSKFNWYLLLLAIIELVFCLIVLINYLFSVINETKVYLHELNKISGIIIDFIIHTSNSCSNLLTLLLSIDRLYAIKFPLKIKLFVTNLHTRKLMASSLALLILLKSISTISCEFNIKRNIMLYACTLVSPFIFNLVPLITILILNIWLVKEIIFNNNKKESTAIQSEVLGKRNDINSKMTDATFSKESYFSKPNNSNYNKSTSSFLLQQHGTSRKFCRNTSTNSNKSHYTVIVLVSIWSILSTILYNTKNFYFSMKSKNEKFSLQDFEFFNDQYKTEIFLKIQMIASILFNSTHCINFFIYLSFYSSFRTAIYRLISCKILSKDPPPQHDIELINFKKSKKSVL